MSSGFESRLCIILCPVRRRGDIIEQQRVILFDDIVNALLRCAGESSIQHICRALSMQVAVILQDVVEVSGGGSRQRARDKNEYQLLTS